MVNRLSLFFFTLLVLSASCRKTDDIELTIRGVITDYRNDAGVGGVTVRLDEQALQSGTVSSAFTNAGQTVTASDGSFELVFPRENALLYRITLTKEGYFNRQTEVNPDNVRPNAPYDFEEIIIPRATLVMKITNENPQSEDDLMRFRKLNALFDCVCCNNEFIDFHGAAVDTTLTCELYGDHNLTYTYTVYRLEDTQVVDSVFCPAFHTTELVIGY